MANHKAARVAVIGGGCASIAAAFELSRPEHRGRYEVTVYQLGWRLGGKGASGRGACGRIEEHGLHIWLGFYENAFRLMRECYRELDRNPETCPIATWRDAFFPDPFVGMADIGADGRWLQWTALFPDAGGEPGDPLNETNPFSIQGYMGRALALLKTLVFDVQTHRGADKRQAADRQASPAGEAEPGAADTPEGIAAMLGELLRFGRLGTTTGLIEAFAVLEVVMRAIGGSGDGALAGLLKARRILRSLKQKWKG